MRRCCRNRDGPLPLFFLARILGREMSTGIRTETPMSATRRTLCFVSCCLTLLLLGDAMTASAGSGSWPSWRGPNRDGISPEKGLLDSWSEQGPPLKWKAKGLGKGYSSVSIDGGRIYTMGAGQGPNSG